MTWIPRKKKSLILVSLSTLSYAHLSWAIYVKFLPGLNKITYPVKNPVHVQIFQALQCHDNVALDVCRSQNNTCVFNDNLMSIYSFRDKLLVKIRIEIDDGLKDIWYFNKLTVQDKY